MKLLLDTNVCIDYLNASHPNVVDRFHEASPEDLVLSSVVVAELRYGADKSVHKQRNHDKLDVLTAEIQCVDFDLEAASSFGRVRAGLEAKGTPIGPYDMMIGGHALALSCVLVTDNVEEFRRIEGLVIENWRQPPASPAEGLR